MHISGRQMLFGAAAALACLATVPATAYLQAPAQPGAVEGVKAGVDAWQAGDFAGAVTAMRPALGVMDRLGGSHAQQDVFEQLFLDAAMKADSERDVRMLLKRVAHRHPVPPRQRAGYAEAARRFGPARRVTQMGKSIDLTIFDTRRP